MDILFIIHLLLTTTLLSIPFWPLDYLKYGVYIPLIISIIWLFFNGCPLTNIQDIDSDSFTQELLKPFIPNITTKHTEHFNTFLLLFITVIGFYRLRGDNTVLSSDSIFNNNNITTEI
jgi:hypothetical protein